MIADNLKLKSIAFPNISTGVYGFPKERAASIAINEIKNYFREEGKSEKVIFAVFDMENLKIYQDLMSRISAG
jgi:O-acetyl-ADP-ribose deacetylase (regulator of RNase III)